MDDQLLGLLVNQPSVVKPLLLWWLIQNEEYLPFMYLVLPIEHIRPDNYFEDWLPQYIEYDFFGLFRMSRESFQNLVHKIGRNLNLPYTGGEMPISAEKKILMTLWWLGKGEVLLSVSDKFNVTLSAVYKSTGLVLKELVSLQFVYIVWPNMDEIETIVNDFQQRGNIPGVIGAIDGCNIPFKAPSDQQDSYIDRKQQHSIKLQGICTANKFFTNILVGWPGSVHDSRVFQNCEIYARVSQNINRGKYFPTLEHHLIGDSAYPLLDWVLTPYRYYTKKKRLEHY